MTQHRAILWFAIFAVTVLVLPEKTAAQSATVTDDAFLSTNANTQKLNLGGQGISLIVSGSSAMVGSVSVGTTTTYIKFQLASSLPPGAAAANVAKATLKLYLSPLTSPTGAIDIYPVTSAWTESTLSSSSTPTIAATPFASGINVGSANSFLVVDVTQLVQEWLEGATNGGIVNDGIALVAHTSSSYVVFDSKESIVTSHEPRLEIVLANSGAQGPAGAAATIQVGTTSTLGPNGQASVTNGGTTSAAILNFAIPQGQPGAPGAPGAPGQAATIKVEPTMTVLYPAPASVMNGGTANAADLTFLIPQGPPGATGAQGPQGPVGINNLGAWSRTAAYNKNDAIFDSASYWLAATANSNSEPSPTNTNWQLLARGVVNQGPWSSSTSYNVNDVVFDSTSGSSWLATAANTGSQPTPTNTSWQLLAAKGDTGAQGAAGAAGAAGQSVASSAEPAGVNCAFGGSKLVAANGTTYACNGVPGPQGPSVMTVALPAGNANCPYGGTQFTSASGTTYACNGAPAGPQFYTVSGTLSGLASTTIVVLDDNGADALTLNANGTFTFATPLAPGSTYAVTVATQPANGTCTVTNGTGTVGVSNVTNITINCTVPIVVTTLASNQDHPSAILVDDTNLYWIDEPPSLGGAPGIFALPLAGGSLNTLVPHSASAFTMDLNNLYYTFGSFYQIPKKGGTEVTIVGGNSLGGSTFAPFAPIFGLAVDAQNAYFIDQTTVAKSSLGTNSNFFPFFTVPPGCQPFSILLDDTNVYWTETGSGTNGCTGGRVMSLAKTSTSGGPSTVIASGLKFPAGLAMDSTNLYWANNGDGTIMMAPKAGGPPTTLASGQTFPFGIYVDSQNVYWTNQGTSTGGTIMKVPIGGGAPTVVASGQNFPMAITGDQQHIYWTNNTGPNNASATGSVMKANK